MKKRLFRFILMLVVFMPVICQAEDDSNNDIVLKPQKRPGKSIPFRYVAVLAHHGDDYCLETDYPYNWAIIEVSDCDGITCDVMAINPDNCCGSISIKPDATINVTFDSGLILTGTSNNGYSEIALP